MGPAEQSSGKGGTELGRFLRACRTRVSPGDVGLTVGAGLRRTPGLRREELATLAGISVDYYIRLERGKETRPSASVIDSLAHALRLGETEHEHLRELAASVDRHATPSAPPTRAVAHGMDLLLESMRPNPAHVLSRTMDLLAANPGGLRLLAGIEDWPVGQRNVARYVFLHPVARDLFDDWENQVRACIARLRALAGVEPHAPDLIPLVDELLRESPEFASLWERYLVTGHSHGRKTFHHPDVGDFTLGYQGMALNGTNGQYLVAYYSEPDSPEYKAMVLLDAAAQEQASTSTPRT